MITPTLKHRTVEQTPPDQPVVMKQTWSNLLFLHWEYDAAAIQKTLPEGLYVDRHKGKAYLGVVPFRMEKIRPRFMPAVPGLSWFSEINLRTYVHDSAGRPGVWFYSLDCNQPLAVEFARTFFHLPYQHSKMKFRRKKEQRFYSSKRRGETLGDKYIYEPAEESYLPAEKGALEFFLTERYLLYSTGKKGELYSGSVHHSPYQLQQAKVSKLYSELFQLEGFSPPKNPVCSELIAKAVDVQIYPLKKHVAHTQ